MAHNCGLLLVAYYFQLLGCPGTKKLQSGQRMASRACARAEGEEAQEGSSQVRGSQGPYEHIEGSYIPVRRPKTRGIPETMTSRILLFECSLGQLW